MRVSVIIPAYEAIVFLRQAIESALSQTRPPLEVIVVNDGSPDTLALEAEISTLRPRITYIRQENGGPGAARNAALACARGDYAAFLDADDWWEPDLLERQLARFERDPALDLVYCDGWIGGDTPLAGRRFMELSPSAGEATFEALLTCRCTVMTSGAIARMATLRAADGFDASLRRGQDFDLWLRLARSGARIGYQHAPLVHRRVHSHNLSGDATTENQRVIDVLSKPCWRDLPIGDRVLVERRVATHRATLDLQAGKTAIAAGDFAIARARLAAAASVDRRFKLWLVRAALALAPRVLRYAAARRSASGKSPAAPATDSRCVPSGSPPPAAAGRNAAGAFPAI
jgi:glycosyltransferase involved in cell wall biosynthesis